MRKASYQYGSSICIVTSGTVKQFSIGLLNFFVCRQWGYNNPKINSDSLIKGSCATGLLSGSCLEKLTVLYFYAVR